MDGMIPIERMRVWSSGYIIWALFSLMLSDVPVCAGSGCCLGNIVGVKGWR
jgi:hypothetical protein